MALWKNTTVVFSCQVGVEFRLKLCSRRWNGLWTITSFPLVMTTKTILITGLNCFGGARGSLQVFIVLSTELRFQTEAWIKSVQTALRYLQTTSGPSGTFSRVNAKRVCISIITLLQFTFVRCLWACLGEALF